MHELLVPLNEPQRRAVQTVTGPVLILAGAGSGKTKTLIHRIAYLIATKQARPENILAVTFTNKAAKEMKARLQRLLTGKISTWPTMGTFHSTCAQLLRREIAALHYDPRFNIYDEADSINLVKKVMKDLRLDTKAISPNSVRYRIAGAKNELLEPSAYEDAAADMIERTAAACYTLYQAELQRNSALDFEDLLRLTVKIFQEQPAVLKKYQQLWRYILVDEYQDTNHAQYVLVKLLAKEHHNLCVVGDDYQSVYSWRGANLQNILDFEEDYPKATVILLEQNYRSTKIILEAANEIIKYNVKQKEKKLWTENDRGHKIVIKAVPDQQAEGEYIIREIFMPETAPFGGITSNTAVSNKNDLEYVAEDDSEMEPTQALSQLDRIMASRSWQQHQLDQRLRRRIRQQLPLTDLTRYVILYRTNAQSRALEEAFLKYQVPYRIVGGLKFYERKEIKDLIAYVRTVMNPLDWVSMERIVNVPARGLGPTSWQKIENACRDRELGFLKLTAANWPSLRPAQRTAAEKFQTMLRQLHTAAPRLAPSAMLDLIIKQSHFKDQFNSKLPDDLSRLENVDELKTVTKSYDHLLGLDGLQAFLEEVTLVSDQDELNEQTRTVNLMTIHAAKGLEFDTVFICGLEEGLFPHARSLFQPTEMEEERRLCYVALTRAKQRAYCLYAEQRTVYGTTKITAPSRFLADIPEELVHRPL